MKRFWKISKIVLGVLFIFLIQNSFISSLSGFWGQMNLYLISVAIIFILSDFWDTLPWALSFGFLLDIYSFYPFGIFLFSWFIALLLVDFAWNNFFTNRSIYSFLALGLLLSISYNLLSYFLLLIFNNSSLGLTWLGKTFFLNFFLEFLSLAIAIILFFYFWYPRHKKKSSLFFEKG